jgi:hypothetical protein
MKNIFTPSLRGLLAINNKILFCYMSWLVILFYSVKLLFSP